MSISPQAGQPTWPMSAPSSQNAGQNPGCESSLIRACQDPPTWANRPSVLSRALVQAPSRPGIAAMTRWPRPSVQALADEPV